MMGVFDNIPLWARILPAEPPEPPKKLGRVAPLESLIPYARNARTHSDAQVAQIAASIAEFGFTNPILIDDKGVIAGHGRLAAARLLYQAGKTLSLPGGDKLAASTVPVIDCTGWSDAKRRAYVIADNRLALDAGWDDEMLKLELGDLAGDGFDLALLGFTGDELQALMHGVNFEPGTEEDQSRLDQKNPTVCPSCGHEF